jgi:exopolyphosphatase/guanosine-5'-triphosphate,3'-diphosphate pyrophosphatase
VLRPDEIEAVAADLAGRTSDARRMDPTIEPARADVLVAGAILFARVVRRMREGAVTISDGGLRWALADALLG